MSLVPGICFTVLAFAAIVADAQRSPVVQTKTGPIRGRRVSVSPSQQVYEFLGIPFAEPPTGDRRFRKTASKSAWQDTLDATRWPSACPQMPFGDPSNPIFASMKPKAEQSEDCLYLNVWVPVALLDRLTNSSAASAKGAAMFTWIHGGGYSSGATSLDMYNGSVLAAYNNIVVTTIQYRLGSLGFAYDGTDQMPGNMGLWDQMEAMKWICENAASFGGNCSDHTIAGESAGGASVTFHLLSPQSRQYFKRAIVESGTATTPWGVHPPETAEAVTQIMASALCNQTSNKLACLKRAPADALPKADMLPAARGFAIPFAPVVDGSFVPRDPKVMLKNGDFYRCPLLIGANKDEGSIFVLMAPGSQDIIPFGQNEKFLADLNYTHYKTLLKSSLSAFTPAMANTLLSTAVELHYWPTTHDGYPAGREVVNAIVQAIGDFLIACPTYQWAKEASRFRSMGSQIYTYQFTQRTSGVPLPQWLGVIHGAEIPYVFGGPFFPDAAKSGFSQDDKVFSRVLMLLWSNFVKYGDPNIRDVDTINLGYGPLQQRPWPTYVDLDCDNQIAEMNSVAQVYAFGSGSTCALKARDCNFWNEFLPKLQDAVMARSSRDD